MASDGQRSRSGRTTSGSSIRASTTRRRAAVPVGEELYAAKKTDRGHLTRYLDVAWGTKAEALKRSGRHVSLHQLLPAALRLQSDPGALAGHRAVPAGAQGEEGQDADQRDHRADLQAGTTRSTGTSPWTRRCGSRSSSGRSARSIRDDGTLSATAFILSQDDITSLPGFEAFLDVTEVQTTIRNVEKRTGLQVPRASRQRPPRGRWRAGNARARGSDRSSRSVRSRTSWCDSAQGTTPRCHLQYRTNVLGCHRIHPEGRR